MKTAKRENQLFLIMIISYFIVNTAWGFLPGQDTVLMQRLTVIAPELTMLIPGVIFLIISREKWLDIIRFRRIPLVVVLLLIIMTVTLIPFISLCNAFSMLFATNLIQDEIGGMLTGNLLFGLFSMALFPAIVEEMVYRGILCQNYIKINWRKGVILSGFLFGIMHMNFNQFFYAFIMGILLAVIVEMTDSILGAMIVHFVFNGSSVILSYVMEWVEKFVQGVEPMTEQISSDITLDLVISLIPAGAISLIISMMILGMIGKITGRLELVLKLLRGERITEEKEHLQGDKSLDRMEIEGLEEGSGVSRGNKIWTPSLIAGIALCVLMAVTVEIVARM